MAAKMEIYSHKYTDFTAIKSRQIEKKIVKLWTLKIGLFLAIVSK
jgi:hypothetical protein